MKMSERPFIMWADWFNMEPHDRMDVAETRARKNEPTVIVLPRNLGTGAIHIIKDRSRDEDEFWSVEGFHSDIHTMSETDGINEVYDELPVMPGYTKEGSFTLRLFANK